MLKLTSVFVFALVFAVGGVARAVPFSGGMTLWLNANESTSITKDGSNRVAAWNDLSGSGNHATQTNNDNKPIWNGSGTLNGRTTIQFDGAVSTLGDYMSLGTNDLFDVATTNGFSFYSIAKLDATTITTYPSLLSAQAGQSQQIQFFRTARAGYDQLSFGSLESSRLRAASATDFNTNWQMFGTFYNGAGKSTAGNYELGIDGKDQTLSGSSSFASNTTATSYLGASGDAVGVRTDQNWLGDMAEVLVYDRLLNTAEQYITENYLSSKFNLDLTASGKDRYQGDTPANSNFDADVFGIGRRDDGLNPGSVSTGTARTITIEITSGLEDDDFLLAGFQNEGEADATTIYMNGTNLEGNETVTLTFDTAQLSVLDTDGFLLGYDASNPLGLTDLGLTPSVDGSLVSFQFTGPIADGFYGLLVVAVPEPSSLLLLVAGLCLMRRRRK